VADLEIHQLVLWLAGGMLALAALAQVQPRRWRFFGLYAGLTGLVALAGLLPPVVAVVAAVLVWSYGLVGLGGLMQMYGRRVAEARFDGARRLLEIISLLYPMFSFAAARAALTARILLERGDVVTGLEDLTLAAELHPELRPTLLMVHAMLDGSYEQVLREAASRSPDDAWMLALVLAHGERGDPQALLQLLARRSQTPTRSAAATLEARLLIAAYLGRADLVRQMLAGPLRRMEGGRARLWQATADYVARGDHDSYQAALGALGDHPSALIRGLVQARQRLGGPRPAGVPNDNPAFNAMVGSLVQPKTRSSNLWRAPGSLALVAVNCLVFGVQALLGPVTLMDASTPVLIDMGAVVVPTMLYDGSWWRLVTAAFLHGGVLHLAFNMLGTLVLCPPVEQRLGGLRLWALFLVTAAASMGFGVAHQLAHSPGIPFTAVGASGGIFGVLGGWLTLGVAHAMRPGMKGHPQRWSTVTLPLMIIALQTPFDYAVLGAGSSTLHLAGFLAGVSASAIIGWTVPMAPRIRAAMTAAGLIALAALYLLPPLNQIIAL